MGYRGAIFDVDGVQATKDGNMAALGVAQELLLGAGADLVVTTLGDVEALAEDRLEQRSR